jgi:hypothetical protein
MAQNAFSVQPFEGKRMQCTSTLSYDEILQHFQNVDRTTALNRLRQEILTAERSRVIRLRDQGRIDDEVLRLVERELDLEEQNLHGDW